MSASYVDVSQIDLPHHNEPQSIYSSDECWHYWSWWLARLSWITPRAVRKARIEWRLCSVWSTPLARLAGRAPLMKRFRLVFAFVVLWTRTRRTNHGGGSQGAK